MMVDILFVEDNLELASLIQAFLVKSGFSLSIVHDGEAAIAWMKQHQAKLVLLDIMLPGMDGFAVCEKIRVQQNLPILMMSARSSKDDQLMGFELGADDYLTKSVDPEILTAKIKALLHRFYQEPLKNILISGAISIDQKAHIVYLNEVTLSLSIKEYELLLIFVKNPGKTLHKEYLFNQIWGIDSESESQTLTVHIKMLRTKIEKDAKNPQRILTLWGIGYRYEEI